MARTYPARGINGHETWKHKAPQHPIISVQPGDQVHLAWWGDSGVPQWCSRSWATVVKVNPKRIVVWPHCANSSFTLTVLPERHVDGVVYIKENAR